MLKLVVGLLILWAVLSIAGFLIEGLLWLAFIGLALFAVTVLWGWIQRRRSASR